MSGIDKMYFESFEQWEQFYNWCKSHELKIKKKTSWKALLNHILNIMENKKELQINKEFVTKELNNYLKTLSKDKSQSFINVIGVWYGIPYTETYSQELYYSNDDLDVILSMVPNKENISIFPYVDREEIIANNNNLLERIKQKRNEKN